MMKNIGIKIIIFSICAIIALLILLNWSSIAPSFLQNDQLILHEINNGRVTAFDSIFVFLTNTSSYVALGGTALVFLLSFVKKSPVLKKCGWQLLVTFLCAFIVIKTLKYSINRERPFDTYTTIDQIVEIDTPSFPSGHTLESAAMAATVVLLFSNKALWAFAITWAMSVAFSRMLLGVHYPSDVLAGISLGILVAFLCDWFFRKRISAYFTDHSPEKSGNQAT
ncbi:phosphatase PAP2 family protein [Daejeonella oryzae]|uniref:phosphatase PAP2 family protein n=1 Tax=Daejeonella oryzae TaxID=1122943 RepID=UPI000686726D|nr:phosphatase PAP2 family protein [Daejeonella oryzae]